MGRHRKCPALISTLLLFVVVSLLSNHEVVVVSARKSVVVSSSAPYYSDGVHLDFHRRKPKTKKDGFLSSSISSLSLSLSSPTSLSSISSIIQISRGGGTSDLPQSSTYWSTRTNTHPSSSSSQSQIHPTRRVRVTDVTQEYQDQERVQTKEQINAFLTRDDRNKFITRVYAILSGQLLITVLSIFGFTKVPSLTYWMATKGRIIPTASLLLSTVSYICMIASEDARRSSPMKWNLLALFTFGEAVAVGFISSFYKSTTVMTALSSTALATITVTGYTLMNKNPKYDLSQWGAGLSSIGTIFIFYGLVQLLSSIGWLPRNFLPYNETLYSMLGASLFTMYLAYHTRLIVAGKHSKYQLNEKDYVFGAVLLYNDIINTFLYLLRLLESLDDDSD